MRRIMVRLDDALYTATREAAYDARTSLNGFVVQAINDKVGDHGNG